MKTVFITSFHALISRNIVMAGVPALLARTHKVVLLVPKEKATFFAEEYGGENIVIEGVDVSLERADRILRSLILAVTHTKGLSIKKRAKYFADRRLGAYLGALLPSALLRGARPVVTLLRLIDPWVMRSKRFAPLFEKYHPSLVFSTDMQNEMDVRLIEEAKSRGVKTLGMVRSWDNISSKGLLRVLPERAVVHNESLKRQMVEKNFMPPERVVVVGIPHYDRYFAPQARNKEQFCTSLGLDPNKPLILFAPIGDRYIRDNKLDALILTTLAEIDANILVRLPPTDTIAHLPVPHSRARIAVQETGRRPWKSSIKGASKLNEITRDDEQTLVDSLANADVLVTGHSTMVIDAAAFDLPSVIAVFDHEPRHYFDSMRRYYDYEYYPPVIDSGGVFVANSPAQLKELVERSLGDRVAGREGRLRLIREQAAYPDTQSSERLVGAVEAML